MSVSRLLPVLGAALIGQAVAAQAADLVTPPRPAAVAQVAASEWSVRITPYGWLPSMSGSQTVRGRTADVSANFVDMVEKSDSLIGLMGDIEIRRGAFSLLGDVAWSRVELGANAVTTRSVAPVINQTVGRSLGLVFQMAIVEAGVAYEFAQSGPWAFDVMGGARGWFQKADLSLDANRTIDIGDLQISGARAISRSGSVQWVDPLVGGRIRYEIAPGHQLSLRGDVGGFGVGSKFSWQAVAAYRFDFAQSNGVIYSGILGYRALYVDYAKGEGRQRYGFDMLQHGPVIGLSARF